MKHALIIGAAKCGTTSLYQAMIQHPQICECRVKEPQWFANGNRSNIRRDVGTYEELWPGYDSAVHKYALEASTGYTKSYLDDQVARKIHEYMPDVKMIYITRDPEERNRSHKNMRLLKKYHPMPDAFYDNVSDYELQLSYYYEYFSEDSILVLDFKTLTDPNFSLVMVWDFLEIERHDIKLGHKNKSKYD